MLGQENWPSVGENQDFLIDKLSSFGGLYLVPVLK